MTTTHILENQVANLESKTSVMDGEEYVRADEVIDLIRGVEEDLFGMEEKRALTEAHDLLYERFYEIDDLVIEVEQARNPFTDLFIGPVVDFIVDNARGQQDDLEAAMDVISDQIESYE